MTREEAIKILKEIIDEGWLISDFDKCIAIDACEMAIKALEVEPLTDIEQRIFLVAMSKEEKVCGVNLVAVCHRIERKVRKALWQ